ncbi:MAG: aldo/keto reductase [Luteolibacter sp.]
MNNSIVWSKLGLGTGTLASLGRAASLSQVDNLISMMLKSGVTVIDTADCYGSGDCERLLGRALGQKRKEFTVITKAGYRLSDLPGPLRLLNPFIKKGLHRWGRRQIFDPAYLAKCLDHSLSRLGMEQVDAFLLHDPPLEVVSDESVIRACGDFRKSGKTILTGISSGDPAVLKAAIASGAFGVIQTPANLKVAGTLKPLWRECEANQIHVIGNHVFDPSCVEIPGMTHEKLMRGSAALLPGNSTVLCGTRNPSHLRQSNEWVHDPLSETDAERLSMEFGARP